MTLIARWKLDLDYKDYSGVSEVDMTGYGSPNPVFTTGKINNAIIIDDSDSSYAAATLTDEFDGLTNWSISFWMRYLDTPVDWQFMFYCWGPTNYRTFAYYFNANDMVVAFIDNTVTRYVSYPHTSHSADTDKLWHHYVGTWDGTYIRLYMDNVLVATSANYSGATPGQSPENIRIGNGDHDSELDDFRIYDHVLTDRQRMKLYHYRPNVELEIGTKDYTGVLQSLSYTSAASFVSREATLYLFDVDQNLKTAIPPYSDFRVIGDGNILFRGEVKVREHIQSNSVLKLVCTDYFDILIDRIVAKSYSGQTAKQIIDDITTNYLDSARGEIYFDSTNVESVRPGETYSFDWSTGLNVVQIFRDLAVLEDAVAYVAPGSGNEQAIYYHAKDGQHTNYIADWDASDGTMISADFPERGRNLHNVIQVHGGADISVIVRSPDSITDYQERWAQPIHRPEADTIAKARNYGELELQKYRDPLVTGTLVVPFDSSLEGGKLVSVTDDRYGYTLQDFLILEAIHNVHPGAITTLKVAAVDAGTTALLEEMVKKIRTIDMRNVDTSAASDMYETLYSYLGVSFAYEVEVQNADDSAFGEAIFGTSTFGAVAGTVAHASGSMVLMNPGKEAIRDLIDGSSGDHLASGTGYAGIAVGDGTTTPDPGQSWLDNELSKGDLDGSPTTPTVTSAEMESTYIDGAHVADGDGKVPIGTVIKEIALFDDTADDTGKMYARAVIPQIIKSANNDIIITISITIGQGVTVGTDNITTVGMTEIRDLIIAASSTHLDNTNAHIGAGWGTGADTPFAIGQTDLQAVDADDQSRGIVDGTPGQPTNTSVLFDSTFVDGDATPDPKEITTDEYVEEVGLFNHETEGSGDMIMRQVIPDLKKLGGTDIIFEIELYITEMA